MKPTVSSVTLARAMVQAINPINLISGGGFFMRTLVAAAVACLTIVGLSHGGESRASIRKTISIPAEGLGAALQTLSKEQDVQVVFMLEDVERLSTPGVSGEMTLDEALSQLLQGTGLKYEYVDEETVTIVPMAPAMKGKQIKENSAEKYKEAQKDASFWEQFRLAQADIGNTKVRKEQDGAPKLEEVVVTAEKRPERLIETPQSVTVLSADTLDKLAATQFRDYANTVPGLTFNTLGAGYTQVTLRGVTTGTDLEPTVGIYIDDVPYGSNGLYAGGASFALDVAPFDLDRIEVLKGPQGTLYGASTMGGLIKYVTKRPDANGFSGDVQTGVSDTHRGGVSYNVAADLNVPLSQNILGLRITGFESRDGGYIDNVGLNHADANRADTYGGRIDLLFTPSDALSLRIVGFTQTVSRGGAAIADYTLAGAPVYGDLDQHRLTAESFHQPFHLASATVVYNFGWASLTSVTSYQTVRSHYGEDVSSILPLLLPVLPPGSYSALGDVKEFGLHKFNEELRLASSPGNVFEWLAGAVYDSETSTNLQYFLPRDLAGNPTAPAGAESIPSLYKDAAVFGDITWHLSGRLDLTGGVRYANNKQQNTFNVGGVGVLPPRNATDNVTTYLADTRYHFSENAIGYLRFATGYRPGGVNLVANDPATGQPIGPASYGPDRLRSYEAGLKSQSSDHRFSAEASVFHIDWTDIQVFGTRDGAFVATNAPKAKIDGGELSLSARPVAGLSLVGAFGYQHSRLAADAPDLGGTAGETLPNVPRFSGSILGDYTFVPNEWKPTVGATVRSVSSSQQELAPPIYRVPSYVTYDVRAGASFGRTDLQLYVHNLSDKRAQFSEIDFGNTAWVAIMQPRTVGLIATTHF